MTTEMTFEQFRDEMWNDTDVEYATRQSMNDYDPDLHGRRVAAERDFKEREIEALWKEKKNRKE